MQQKQSQTLEMQVELGSVKDRATELQEQLSSEKMVVSELKSELARTKLELEATLKAQHKHLKELEAFRCATLLDCNPVLVQSEVAQSCPTLCDPMDYSRLGSSVRGISQARVPEWVAISFSRGSSQPRDRTQVSCIAGRCFTIWATREAIKVKDFIITEGLGIILSQTLCRSYKNMTLYMMFK